jgi:hypothetical protein
MGQGDGNGYAAKVDGQILLYMELHRMGFDG